MAPVASLPWQHPWIQSPSVINQISLFATLKIWNTRGTHNILTLFVSLLSPLVKHKLGMSVFIEIRQRQNVRHFMSFVTYIYDAKFEEQRL